jgi:hypothetical protein
MQESLPSFPHHIPPMKINPQLLTESTVIYSLYVSFKHNISVDHGSGGPSPTLWLGKRL